MEKEGNNRRKEERLHRDVGLSIREVDEEKRTAQLSFSSETAYQRWWGVEILDHSEGCIDLSRLKEIGCVLYNHNRDKVVGAVQEVWVEGGRGYARVRFDEDDESEKVFQKVKGGSLKGVSVGYAVSVWEKVQANQKSQDGRFTGPCEIAKSWEPYEISIVSIPADSTVGVGRTQEDSGDAGRSLDCFSRQLQINRNKLKVGKRR